MSYRAKISVVTPTYGQASFILCNIKGVLSQKYEGDIEYIIVNDNSPDDTDAIITDFIKSTLIPGNITIRYIKNDKNKGAIQNFIWSISQSKGDYIAVCEGDDYWTDSQKLQKQVNFLELNKDYSICFHDVEVKYENNIVPFLIDSNKYTKETTDLHDLLRGNFIHTPSVVFRNNNDYPDWLFNGYPGDWPLHVINATYGKLKFMPEKMATYRVHTGGVHSTTGGQIEKSFETFRDIIKELERRGLKTAVEVAKAEYKRSFARYYGFSKSSNINFNRFKKSSLILKSGDKKLRLFFWLPLIFNNSSNEVLKIVLKKIRK